MCHACRTLFSCSSLRMGQRRHSGFTEVCVCRVVTSKDEKRLVVDFRTSSNLVINASNALDVRLYDLPRDYWWFIRSVFGFPNRYTRKISIAWEMLGISSANLWNRNFWICQEKMTDFVADKWVLRKASCTSLKRILLFIDFSATLCTIQVL